MLNGKSYLISITALFSKKSYDMAVAVEIPFDEVRDTQYHLTAPARSTYRALKMEELKFANRLPYAATSLFSGALKEATIETVVEGVEMDSAVAAVADYLSEIQQQLAGENIRAVSTGMDEMSSAGIVLDASGSPLRFAEAGDITREEYLAVVDKFYGSGTQSDAEAISPVTDTSATFSARAEAETPANLVSATNLTTEIRDVKEIVQGVAAPLITDTEDAVIYAEASGSPLDLLGGAVDGQVSAGNRTASNHEAIVDRASPGINQSWELSATIEEAVTGEIGTEARSGEVEALQQAGKLDTREAELGVFVEGLGSEQVDTLVDRQSVAELVRSAVSDSPEIVSASRLLEIMYGQRAAETIQAGMSSLVDTWVADGSYADAGAVTDAVVTQLKEALSESSSNGVMHRLESSFANSYGDAEVALTETGSSNSSADGVDAPTVFAYSGNSADAQMVDIGKAIAEANRNLQLHNPSQASLVSYGEGVIGPSEEGVSLPSVDGEEVYPETAMSSPTYLGYSYETEQAERSITTEGLLAGIEGGRNASPALESVEVGQELGSKEEIYMNAVVGRHELGSHIQSTMETIIDEGDQSSLYPTREGQLDTGVVEGSGDSTLNAVLEEMAGMQGDTVYDAGIEQTTSGGYSRISEVVIEDGATADSTDNEADTLIEPMVEAESVKEVSSVPVDDLVSSARKKRIIPTAVEKVAEPDRKKRMLLTVVERGEEVDRAKRVISASVEKTEESVRPKKVIPTVIERPSEGTHQTPPEEKKGKLWLIMGKIANWNIWDWKKTR